MPRIDSRFPFLRFWPIWVLGFAIYAITLDNAFVFDDVEFIRNNEILRNAADPLAIWAYHPARFLTFFSFALNYSLGEQVTTGYHLVNLLIHLACSTLVGWLAWLLPRPAQAAQASRLAPALLAAAIFVAHPLQTQAVTYIWQRATSLSTLFYLASLVLFLKARFAAPNRKAYFMSLAFGLAAMFCKEIAFTLPFAVLAVEFIFFADQPRPGWRFFAPYATLLLVIPVLLLVSFALYEERLAIGNALSPLSYLLTQISATPGYLRLLLFPFGQNLDHDFEVNTHVWQVPVLLHLALLGGLAWLGFRLGRRKSAVFFGFLFFFLALSVEAASFVLPDVFVEHRVYLPMVGFSLFAAFGLTSVVPARRVLGVALALPLLLAAVSFRRNLVWESPERLWRDVVTGSPNKARGWVNLGMVLADDGNVPEALDAYSRALELDPDHVHGNLLRGLLRQKQGQNKEALSDYNHFLELQPGHAVGHNNRGAVLLEMGRYGEALNDFTQALATKPDYGQARYNHGLANAHLGHKQAAIADFDAALLLMPEHAASYLRRGFAHHALGDEVSAVRDYESALGWDEQLKEAHLNLALILYKTPEARERAMAHFAAALAIEPGFTKVWMNRGSLLFNTGDYQQALDDFDQLVAAEPSPKAFYRRGLVYLRLGDHAAARADLQRAQEGGLVLPEALRELLQKKPASR